jgi:hypothetical protein
MPRLIGKSSKTPVYLGTALVIAIAGGITLEYLGVIDVVPNFGKDRKMISQSERTNRRMSNSTERNF